MQITPFLKPQLLFLGISDKPVFSSVERLFQESLQEPDLTPCSAGALWVSNDSQTSIKCQGETIKPGMSALFASIFTPVDVQSPYGFPSQAIQIDSALLLEDNYGMVLSSNESPISLGINRIVTVMPRNENSIVRLIAQFERYLSQRENSKDLFNQRKENNPEFNSFVNDPKKYVERLKTRNVFIITTRIHSAFTRPNA